MVLNIVVISSLVSCKKHKTKTTDLLKCGILLLV